MIFILRTQISRLDFLVNVVFDYAFVYFLINLILIRFEHTNNYFRWSEPFLYTVTLGHIRNWDRFPVYTILQLFLPLLILQSILFEKFHQLSLMISQVKLADESRDPELLDHLKQIDLCVQFFLCFDEKFLLSIHLSLYFLSAAFAPTTSNPDKLAFPSCTTCLSVIVAEYISLLDFFFYLYLLLAKFIFCRTVFKVLF